MVFESNPRVTRTIIIVTVSLVALFWGAANGLTCCDRPDQQLTAECANGSAQLRWVSSIRISFGFDLWYNCNSNETCDGGKMISYKKSEVDTLISNVSTKSLTNPDFGNTICWFWVKALRYKYNRTQGCSPIVTCNAASTNTASTLSPSLSTSDLIMPSSLSTSSTSYVSVLSPSMSVLIPSLFLSSSTLSSLSLTSTATTNVVTNTTTTTTTTTTITNTTTTTTTTNITTDITVTATIETTSSPVLITTASILHTSPSTMPSFEPQQNTSPDLYSLLLYITLICTVIILLLFSVCLFFCWRKYKRKQSENYQIEDVCCEDPGELAKESDSETETLTNGNGIGDEISITDDHTYMLRKILRLDVVSLDPSIFTEVDDGSVASHYRTDDGGVDCSHYCGSGGQCIQSNTSSHSRSSSCSNCE